VLLVIGNTEKKEDVLRSGAGCRASPFWLMGQSVNAAHFARMGVDYGYDMSWDVRIQVTAGGSINVFEVDKKAAVSGYRYIGC
jgi:hypothetical protein